ncbi:hypothetical protein C3432_17560 [Citrobacter amalonaticus]|uniref:DUF7916 domain-containing protein n=1 Tax=Citrobacter amalonaticus TaxID=35703 RepID=A0A2S4RTR9_CITAM|nr:hypothetical protein [Citrobacter amalonaticus]POT57164.1 hypothetical protein C3432_17560 [Citrobacter amalonaticus]POT72547.1 hypothetical protein C3436_20325 [Citrobacter amalonaticus]POU63402.1 hypothetical protein C3430_18580 [Citrobacter amalonaticus]POV03166.1 hypothetical protein C3424_21495 [Citrobacter amalonaticus]
MKRILNCRASDFRLPVTGEALREAIVASEGRVIMAEVAVQTPPLFAEVTNAELLCAFGADLLLLKGINCLQPELNGSDDRFGDNPVAQIKCLTGRLTGVSFEVLAEEEASHANAFSPAHLHAMQHADFYCLTGYDKPGVTAERMRQAIAQLRTQTDKLILAAKFYTSGLTLPEEYASYVRAGADGVIFPAPAGCRGASETLVREIVQAVQAHGGIAVTTLSSSQEGADCATVREIGLASKRCGSDMHNFGDAGVAGMADPQALNALSVAIRGRRHTWVRMAASLSR